MPQQTAYTMIDEAYDKTIKHCMVTALVNGVMSVGGSSKFWYWKCVLDLTCQEFYNLLLLLGNNNAAGFIVPNLLVRTKLLLLLYCKTSCVTLYDSSHYVYMITY